MHEQRKPHPMDVHVGKRVKLRRFLVGMSQEELGFKMGLTFQQIQKYEKGTNRIGASRLAHLAYHLEVEVSYFFEDAPEIGPGHSGKALSAEGLLLDFLGSKEGLALNKAFAKIADAKTRRRILALVRDIAGEYEEEQEVREAA